MTSTRGPLRGEDEVDADGAGHLREAGDGLFDVRAVEHHQVGELVDDDDDVGQRLLVDVFEEVLGAVIEELVELVDVADVVGGEELEAALHLADRIAQGIRGELGLGDDGREEVRDALVHAELDALGIDEDHADLLGRGLEQDGHDHGVDGDGFAGAGGAGDEHVRHGGEVGGDDAAVDVFAERDGELALALGEGLALDDVAQPDGFAVVVGHLDADGGFAGHALDEDGFGGHGEAEVVGQAGDAGVLDAGVGAELERGDDGAGIDLGDLAVDAELGAFLDQDPGFFAESFFADDGVLLGLVEERGGGELVAADGLGGDGDGFDVGVGAAAEGDGVAGRGLGGWRAARRGGARWRAGQRAGGSGAGAGRRVGSSRPGGFGARCCPGRGLGLAVTKENGSSCHRRR